MHRLDRLIEVVRDPRQQRELHRREDFRQPRANLQPRDLECGLLRFVGPRGRIARVEPVPPGLESSDDEFWASVNPAAECAGGPGLEPALS